MEKINLYEYCREMIKQFSEERQGLCMSVMEMKRIMLNDLQDKYELSSSEVKQLIINTFGTVNDWDDYLRHYLRDTLKLPYNNCIGSVKFVKEGE